MSIRHCSPTRISKGLGRNLSHETWQKYWAYNKERFLCKAAWWPWEKRKYLPARGKKLNNVIKLHMTRVVQSSISQEWRSAAFTLQGIQHWDQQGSWVSTQRSFNLNFKINKKAAAQELNRAWAFVLYSQQPSGSFHKILLRITVCPKACPAKDVWKACSEGKSGEYAVLCHCNLLHSKAKNISEHRFACSAMKNT